MKINVDNGHASMKWAHLLVLQVALLVFLHALLLLLLLIPLLSTGTSSLLYRHLPVYWQAESSLAQLRISKQNKHNYTELGNINRRDLRPSELTSKASLWKQLSFPDLRIYQACRWNRDRTKVVFGSPESDILIRLNLIAMSPVRSGIKSRVAKMLWRSQFHMDLA